MRVVAVIAMLAGWFVCGLTHAEISGSVDRSAFYRGSVTLADGQCSFEVTFDPVLFEVHTLQGKYRVIRVRVVNRSSTAVALSPAADRFKVRLRGGQEVNAVLNMQQADAAIWDRLDIDTRKALAYPKSIPAGDETGTGRLTQMSFFVFVPANVAHAPESFELTIDSLHQTVVIAPPPATAAKN